MDNQKILAQVQARKSHKWRSMQDDHHNYYDGQHYSSKTRT